ncbi:hypothetical protein GCM10010191_77240 [Actinomadura vinacea]|uniref:N-acetyltransferase domain-containing protein n=1 Tax=Actinomadura vinacea TaxID=115336 RepID=A0ABP5XBM6_9ACTN
MPEAARAAGADRLWLITTNDNLRALRFYQRYGFDLVAVARSRALTPSIPEIGLDGIPIRHELELELPLPPSTEDARQVCTRSAAAVQTYPSPDLPEDAPAFRPGRNPASRGAGQGKSDRRQAIGRPP